MKKIMFNDKFGLTQAVLEGRKTMTRRITNIQPPNDECYICWLIDSSVKGDEKYEGCAAWIHDGLQVSEFMRHYEVGEIVAIAQSYKELGYDGDSIDRDPKLNIRGLMKDSAGWNNKMFVNSYACKHHVKIINIKVERLQGISNEDCLKEGIYRLDSANGNGGIAYSFVGASDKKHIGLYNTPRDAFSALIDKVSGKGTWESNPYVWVYEFELFD